MQYACNRSPLRPSLSKLAGVISSSPIILQPPEARVNRLTLYAGAALGKLLPSLQMKVDIKGTVSSKLTHLGLRHFAKILVGPVTR